MSSSPSFHVVSADETADDPPASYSFNTKIMAGAIIVLFLILFLVLMIHLYARWFLRRSSRPYALRRGIAFSSPNAAHTSTGLDKAVIDQMPTFVYKSSSLIDGVGAVEAVNGVELAAGEAVVDGRPAAAAAKPPLECAVCLCEFQDDENCRMLPVCKHIFHTECIDMWFFSHSTCPLCRTTAGGQAMEPSAESASGDEQHIHNGEGQEAMEALPAAAAIAQGNPVASNMVEYPCNVLFWGNQTQVVSSQEPASSALPLSGSLRMAGRVAVPQISIDIPPIEGNMLVGASGPISAKQAMAEQETASSQPLKSPSIRASIKRMLSRQSSRQRSFRQEAGNEESPR